MGNIQEFGGIRKQEGQGGQEGQKSLKMWGFGEMGRIEEEPSRLEGNERTK